jgi:NAD(P)-dependent dehydrogenase (short-subunit alcohol dehydrogenase family)
MDDLKSKTVIVTGASSGIGLATATALLAAGAHVLGVDISPGPPALSSLPKSHFAFHQCNLTHPESPALVVKAALGAFNGRIDVLLNVAGIGDTFGSVDTLTDETWDRIIATNLTAPVKLMREVGPEMRKSGGGSIVNVARKGGTSGAIIPINHVWSTI